MDDTIHNRFGGGWDGISQKEAYKKANEKSEPECMEYLKLNCDFIDFEHKALGDITTQAGVILPDILAYHKSGKKFIIDVKDKSRRKYYRDNGIDEYKIRVYLEYEEKIGIPMIILFRDNIEQIKGWLKDKPTLEYTTDLKPTNKGEWYGERLQYLIKHRIDNPKTKGVGSGNNKVVYFPLDNMKPAIKLFLYLTHQRQTTLNFSPIN